MEKIPTFLSVKRVHNELVLDMNAKNVMDKYFIRELSGAKGRLLKAFV